VKRLFDLSFRHKLPLWGGTLVVASALAVSGTLMVRAYQDLKQDLLISSASLSRTLATTLLPVLLNDDVWRAFQVVRAPIPEAGASDPVTPDGIVVIDDSMRVIVSSRPGEFPMSVDIRTVSLELGEVVKRLPSMKPGEAKSIDIPDAKHLYVVAPIADQDAHVGTLIISHSKNAFLPRFVQVASRGVEVGLLVLAILLPINWYWGRRMARPLARLALQMNRIGEALPQAPDDIAYPYGDELGQLFASYRVMVGELEKKRTLERQMIQADRLAAIGRLTAAMAHEINNPLGGMLTAIDTLKRHGTLDARAARTMSLIERGLNQIKDSVGALLVEARAKSRPLAAPDLEDVRGLVAPEAHKKRVGLRWDCDISPGLSLPANLVRQVLLNLLLNAIQASEAEGFVDCSIGRKGGDLLLSVTNSGRLLTSEQMSHLFEPFSQLSESGHGLGLWVTYQIVNQLGGHISAERIDDKMVFSVRLPITEALEHAGDQR
jgi:signal transduction histidine kinase